MPNHNGAIPNRDEATRDLQRASILIDTAGRCVAAALTRLSSESPSAGDDQISESSETLAPDDLQLLKAINSIRDSGDTDAEQDDPSHTFRSTYGRGAPPKDYSAGHADWLTRRRDIFARYEQNKDCFTDRQWAVVCRYYRDGLTEERIANQLGVARSAVYDRRRRAEARLKKRETELKKERLRLMRNLAISR